MAVPSPPSIAVTPFRNVSASTHTSCSVEAVNVDNSLKREGLCFQEKLLSKSSVFRVDPHRWARYLNEEPLTCDKLGKHSSIKRKALFIASQTHLAQRQTCQLQTSSWKTAISPEFHHKVFFPNKWIGSVDIQFLLSVRDPLAKLMINFPLWGHFQHWPYGTQPTRRFL